MERYNFGLATAAADAVQPGTVLARPQTLSSKMTCYAVAIFGNISFEDIDQNLDGRWRWRFFRVYSV